MVTDVQGEEVARLRAGDAQAFRTLIERLQQPITGYLHRLVGEREVALDLAQDTFLQVYKEIGKTSLDLSLDAWIYRIATNYGLQYLNRKRLRQFISFSHHTELLGNGTSLNAGSYEESRLRDLTPSLEDQTETRVLVQQVLSQLKPKDAACLQLHYGDGFTYEQIGKIVSISPEAVRKRVTRSVEKFRVIYARAVELPTTQVARETNRREKKRRLEKIGGRGETSR